MSENPYAPPGSRVEDVSTQSVLAGRAFWVRFYLSPVGRTARLHYWLFGLLPLFLIGITSGYFIPPTLDGIRYQLAIGFLVFWPQTAIIVRRLHDLNWMGWWAAVYWLIPVALFFVGTSLPGGAGRDLSLIAAMALGLFAGTVGPNRYGSDPLGGKNHQATAPVGE